ncbi:MAG: peptidoglycan-binding protein [Acidimicrobiia bacterium]|nr:peptidoglycan-binding protein [Acidimicrobiia bacterium]
MRLYRQGDEGSAVRDIQDRLAALGFPSHPDHRGAFADGTLAAVTAFQKAKGLAPDGIVGPDTWRSLYEAGYRFGDRLLFLRRPMIRGEDVSELQSRLNSLGFDAGKVDGIFGPETEHAVIEFQHNRNLAEDGKVGPAVVTEILLVTRGEMKEGREAIREREWLRRLAPTIAGARIYLDAGCRSEAETRSAWEAANSAALRLQEQGGLPVMSRSHGVKLPERVRARRANRLGADLIVAFQLNDDNDDCVFYFASELSQSEAGAQLARAVAARTGGRVEGRANALLKETRAPAIIVSCGELTEKVGAEVTEGLSDFFATNAGAPSSPSP